MKLALSLIAISFLAYGCGSSSSGTGGAAWCGSKYKANNFLDLAGAKKTQLKEDTVLELKDGTYELTNVDLYVSDPERGLRVHVSIPVKDGKGPKYLPKCIGANGNVLFPEMEPITHSISAFSKVIVASGKTTLGGGTVHVDIRYRGDDKAYLEAEFITDESKTKEKSFKDVYDEDGFTDRTQYLYEADTFYELRNKLVAKADEARDEVDETKDFIMETKQTWTLQAEETPEDAD